MARYLLNTGIGKGDVVAIFNEKSPQAFSLMLGCIKIGAIYTNLDTTSPWPRIEKILHTCKPSVVFVDVPEFALQQELHQVMGTGKCIYFGDVDFKDVLQKLNTENLNETAAIDGGSAAYIMFTSGSTGFPKGAVMSHSNLLNFIQWGQQTFSITPQDIFTNANPIYFDNSVFDFYVSLFNGASLVPLLHDLVKNAKQLVQAINNSKCTICFSVPSLLVYLLTTRAISKEDFPGIRSIVFGGEGFPKNKLLQLYQLFGERMNLFNVYGPTECTCICSSYIISKNDFEQMNELAPLGFLAPNFDYTILHDGKDFNFGELCLLGPCVGLGYYNDRDRTAAAFVQQPLTQYRQLMYKTGDLVQLAPNGQLHFKGRTDNQVKHMGYRIELEEVEAALSSLNYVNEAGVLYEKLTPELGQIKAFVNVSDKNIDEKMLLDDVRKILPAYMVPRTVVLLDVLPKNSNGKIDRKQLAAIK